MDGDFVFCIEEMNLQDQIFHPKGLGKCFEQSLRSFMRFSELQVWIIFEMTIW
jgi:hypothetical protein